MNATETKIIQGEENKLNDEFKSSKRNLSENEKGILHEAIEDCDDEKAKTIINIMEDIDESICVGFTALNLSCSYGRIDLAKYLIDLGADVNKNDDYNYSPLINAIDNKKNEIARVLIESGADINFINSNGKSALFQAVCYGKLEMIELLISSGVDVEKCGGEALICASLNGNIGIVEKLLELNVDINYAESYRGYTALHFACSNKNLSLVELLLSNGADENINDKKGKIPIELTKNKEIKEFISNYNSSKYVLK